MIFMAACSDETAGQGGQVGWFVAFNSDIDFGNKPTLLNRFPVIAVNIQFMK